MNTWFLCSILLLSGSPLTSAEWNIKKREYVQTNRIIQTIEELSIVSCHSRCKINPICLSYATEGDVSMGELDTCYLLADHASSSPQVDERIELYTVSIAPIEVFQTPQPSTNEGGNLTAIINGNINFYKVLNDKEYEANGYVYYFANKMGGYEAIKFCKENNHGHVASLLNANEEDLLQYILDNHHPDDKGCLRIGLKRDNTAAKKYGTWLDGSPVIYKRWKNGEVGYNGKFCVKSCNDGWVTDECNNQRFTFCKRSITDFIKKVETTHPMMPL